MTADPIWHGSREDYSNLMLAVSHNCDCTKGVADIVIATCEAHKMLNQQRVLDHMGFALKLRETWRASELDTLGARASLNV